MGSQYKAQFDVQSQSGMRKAKSGKVEIGKVKTYRVSLRHDGSWECDCMSWTRTMPRTNCKHILGKIVEMQAGYVAPVIVDDKLSLEVATGRKFRG